RQPCKTSVRRSIQDAEWMHAWNAGNERNFQKVAIGYRLCYVHGIRIHWPRRRISDSRAILRRTADDLYSHSQERGNVGLASAGNQTGGGARRVVAFPASRPE